MYHVRRIINHFKVVIDPDAIFAKAYAGMDVCNEPRHDFTSYTFSILSRRYDEVGHKFSRSGRQLACPSRNFTNLETDEKALDAASYDFGRTVRRRPSAIAHPGTAQEVVEIIRKSNRQRTPLTIQGAGHSQNGLSLSDNRILVDLKGLNGIGDIEGDEIRVQGGVRWKDLVTRVLYRRVFASSAHHSFDRDSGRNSVRWRPQHNFTPIRRPGR